MASAFDRWQRWSHLHQSQAVGDRQARQQGYQHAELLLSFQQALCVEPCACNFPLSPLVLLA